MMKPELQAYALGDRLHAGHRAAVHHAVRTSDGRAILLKVLEPEYSRPEDVERLRKEYEVGRALAGLAIVEPLALSTFEGRPALELEDFPGAPLEMFVGAPMPVGDFLRLAVRLAGIVADIHERCVIHKKLNPGNILFDPGSGELKVWNFSIAVRSPRAQPPPRAARLVEGTLPYMSPEQTGWMNRSVDSRSDLYALGVTFYELLTGRLPFVARDPLEWVHCHVARTPLAPSALVPRLAGVLSDIVLKLLAKLAEERYQTARGLQHDLERCLSDWQAKGTLAPFALGTHDVSDRLELSHQLYGREAESTELLRAFGRVVEQGTPELVLVSGYSGIGKSSLVRELHRPIVQERGFFISGKVDQYRRDVPYSTFAQAFAELIDQILTESEASVVAWKELLRQALGASAQLIIDIIPHVELILGPQPALPSLPPLEAQNRFHWVFRQFISVFARKEHPLALFLDDLQWLDSGSLKLLEELVLHPQTRYLLLLGAYRDNEVGPSHPLALTLDNLRESDARVRELVLAPLSVEHLGQFLADALRCPPGSAAPLARLVHEKTAGNPFFAIQFLTTLHEEGLLEFDRGNARWRWDVAKIHAKGFTDNVVDLMVRKLKRLPPATQEVLKLAACVGNTTNLHTLAVISNQSGEQVARELSDAVREGLVLQQGDVYTFLHDRVQQGAYVLIEDARKRGVHLRIGRLLLASLDARSIEERIFDVVSQLNHGLSLITDPAERDALARLDFLAGRKAKASIAYASAKGFLAIAAALLPEDAWKSRYDFAFPLFRELAECEYLGGAFEQAEALFDLLLARARTDFDKALVYELRLKLCHVAGRYDEAVAMGLKALQLFGVDIPEDDALLSEATHAEAMAIQVNLGGRRIADLAEAAEATDPKVRAVIGLFSNMAPAAYIGSRPQVFPLVILKLVNHSLRFGHTYESCMGYSCYGVMLVSLYDEPRVAYEFSEMSIRLNQKLGDISRRGTVMHLHGDHINFWSRHISTDFPILERGFLACLDAGDLVFANAIAFQIVWQAIERGDAIDDVLRFSQSYAAFARDSRNEPIYQTIRLEQQFLTCLKGQTRGRTSFEDDAFQEAPCLAKITEAAFGCGLVFFHTMKLITAYLAGDDAEALHHADEAKKTLSAAMAMPMEATFYFFHALLLARIHPRRTEAEQREIAKTLEGYSQKLALWAESCPENFLTKHALVSAELARITGDALQAERCYEEAIRAARANGFVHWEGVANELAAAFYRERRFETITAAYLREARDCYVRWGAEAKVRQLARRHAHLHEPGPLGPAAIFAARPEQFDLLSVVKASQSISGEMVRERLLRTLLQVVLEQGGARRALLVMSREGELEVAAESAVGEEGAPGMLFSTAPQGLAARVPASILQYAQRTREHVLLADAAADAERFSADPYFARTRPRSVLCLPIRRQAELVAFLYLENDLVPGSFTPERLLALELLAAQAAISIENALLLEREHAGRVEAEAAGRRALLLGEATALISSTLDDEGMFDALTRLCARSFAEWAVIDLNQGGTVMRLAGAHRDPRKQPLLRELSERYPARIGTATPVTRVLQGGALIHLPALSDEQIRAFTLDEHHAALIHQLGTRSVLIVPLVARDTPLGALTFVAATAHWFGTADVELAVELGRRAALAIDNSRLLAETQWALRLREEFLTVASHELRTPVTSLRLSVEGLLRAAASGRTVSAETLNRSLNRVLSKTDRLEQLTGEILDVTRIEQGRLELERGEVELGALVRTRVERLEPELTAAGCRVSFTCAAPVVGQWDAARLEQVVTHLLHNALKFGPGKPIEVSVGKEAESARLVVRDHGIGITPVRQGRIFERFERGVSKNYGGLGLGLYLSRRIAEAHGGSIQVQSVPGVGSTFTVTLPCAGR
ncbi:sensor histidine kinase [Pyxidicoccus xibeiensis]|uniref:sensor histidine kinase n=1 Tax=Pyxidicoccus xibeiensis TaxID=2906759 RepID=UPI0020A8068F|nr:ATP-binding sensor histidine kinase [Pyxidicoccus xibeiensis]MCP3142766.1 trifunctional serine/threonine-protein kinase/ATP-binding protein/sensor histidine kinase [Pyxidicoccus xibeiensis]